MVDENLRSIKARFEALEERTHDLHLMVATQRDLDVSINSKWVIDAGEPHSEMFVADKYSQLAQ